MCRHWPIGLIFDYFMGHQILSRQDPLPLLSITLHLSDPPTDKLSLNPSIDACRTNFMNMIKQSDYVRWGNTRRVTSLRKVDQDALWEGVLQGPVSFFSGRPEFNWADSISIGDFDRYWSVASKLMPQPSGSTSSPLERTSSNISQSSATPSGFTSSDASRDPSGMKSVPMRFHLADAQAPALQDVVAPLSSDGESCKLSSESPSMLVSI